MMTTSKSYKPISKIFIESTIVGFGLIILFFIILLSLTFISYFNDKKNHMMHMSVAVFLSGMIFHILCEYTGINLWYVRDYNTIIPK